MEERINLYEDDVSLSEASLDILLEAMYQDCVAEHKKKLANDTDEEFEKVEPYQRKTTEER